MEDTMQGLAGFYFTSLVVVIVIAAYLLPTLVACLRHAPDITAVIVVNLALGWTVLGWWLALALALRKAEPPVVNVFNQVNTPASPPPVNGSWTPHFPQHPGTYPRSIPPADEIPPREE
jgi:hypothetical protein